MDEKQKIARLAELGTATVYEASGRQGLIDLPLIQVVPHSRVAGKARTVLCGQADNVMVHAGIEHIQPGEIVVLAQPESQGAATPGSGNIDPRSDAHPEKPDSPGPPAPAR